MLSTILTILLFINSFVLVFLIIVLQQGNEGGISASFGAGGGQAGFFGPSGGVGLIVKATWIFGISFLVLTVSSSWVRTHDKYLIKTKVEKLLEAETITPPAQVPSPESK